MIILENTKHLIELKNKTLILNSDLIDDNYKKSRRNDLERILSVIASTSDQTKLFLSMYDSLFRMTEIILCDYGYVLCKDMPHVAVIKIYNLFFPGQADSESELFLIKKHRMQIVKKQMKVSEYYLSELEKYYLHAKAIYES